MGHRVRRTVSTASMVSLMALAAACSDEAPAPEPVTQTSAPAPSPSPTPSSAPEPEEEPEAQPLSRFEDEPAVKFARRWAALYPEIVNNEERNFASMESILTPFGREQMTNVAGEDFGTFYPGPFPFTPTGVEKINGRTNVVGCFQLNGFALDREGGIPVAKREIAPARMALQRVDGQFKFVTLTANTNSCEGVSVKGLGS